MKIGNGFAAAGFGSFAMYRGSSTPRGNGFSASSFGSFAMYKDDPNFNAICLELVQTCRYGCPHCVQAPRTNEVLATDEDVLGFTRDFSKVTGARFVSFSGNEATQNLPRLLRHAKAAHEQGLGTILMTHAAYLNERVQGELSGHIDYIDASMDSVHGGHKSVYDAHGQETAAWRNMRSASRNPAFSLATIVTVMRETSAELAELLALLDTQVEGAISTSFFYDVPESPKLLTKAEFNEGVDAFLAIPKRQRVVVVVNHLYEQYLSSMLTRYGIAESGNSYYQLDDRRTIVVPGKIPGRLVRMEGDGRLFYGCYHMPIQGDVSHLQIGTVGETNVADLYA